MKKKLIVFDFDGTLTDRDSMLAFTRFYHGAVRYYLGMLYLLPMLLVYKAGLIPNWRAKEYYLAHFFGGEDLDAFQRGCDRFGQEKIPAFIRPAALRQLEEYRKQGDRLVIVSSSAENWLQAWCKAQHVDLIATRLQIRDNRLTGQLDGINCYGAEKVRRLLANYLLTDYVEVVVYGDSRGDHALFEIASTRHYKPFRD